MSMNQKPSAKSYDPEFQKQAVQLLLTSDFSSFSSFSVAVILPLLKSPWDSPNMNFYGHGC